MEKYADVIMECERRRKGFSRVLWLLMAVFAASGSVAVWFSIVSLHGLEQEALPPDLSPEVLRAVVIGNVFRVLAPLVFACSCLFAVFHLLLGSLPRPDHKLLIVLARRFQEEYRSEKSGRLEPRSTPSDGQRHTNTTAVDGA